MRLPQKLFGNFKSTQIERLPQTSNSHTDALATLASAIESEMKRTIGVEFLPRLIIMADQNRNMVFDNEANLGVYWMDLMIHYFKDGSIPTDSGKDHKTRVQASRYWLSLNQKLYRRSVFGP